jgi:hypothetical protein
MKSTCEVASVPWLVCDQSTECLDLIEQKIRSFMSLPVGWNFGESTPPKWEIVDLAIQIYKIGNSFGLSCEVFPVADGQIEVSLYRNDQFMDILVKENGELELTHEAGIGSKFRRIDHFEMITIDGVKKQLSELPRLCSALESLGTTTTRGKEGLRIVVSATAMAPFQSSTKTASITAMVPQFASIFEIFTPQTQGNTLLETYP